MTTPRASRSTRRGVATTAALAALALSLSTLAVGGAASAGAASAGAADPAPVPQAPVISVISQDEVLPFTIEGGGPIEVAVLTGAQTPADATWTTATELALAPYAGQDVRVLARQPGAGATRWFDADYRVRATYPPASGLGTATNPSVSTPGNDPRIRGWATGWSEVVYGPNVSAGFKTPQSAVGPVGGSGYEGNTGVVVLGDHGHITMTFGSPIVDGAGDDLTVFENGFRVNGQNNDFLELAHLEVSSNGTDFVRFDSGNRHPTPVGGFAGFPADRIGGVAGRDLNGLGTPFDLRALRSKPQVRSGLVDLQAITAVRIVDIVGDGNDRDSFGRPIYDPYPTTGSGGFDLRGVGVLNQQAAAVAKPTIAWTGTTTGRVATAVSPGTAGEQTVRLELSATADHADAAVRGTRTVPASAQVEQLTWDLDGLTSGGSYWYRVVSTGPGGPGAAEKASDWVAFTKTPATEVYSGVPTITRPADAAASAALRTTIAPRTDGDQQVRVEYSPNADHSDLRVTDPVAVAGTATNGPSLALTGLELRADYWYRVVSRSSDGIERTGEWRTFRTVLDPANPTPLLVARAGDKARVRVVAQPGTDSQVSVALQYSTSSGHTTGSRTTEARLAPGSAAQTPLTWELDGITAGTTYYVRAVTTRDGGVVRTSGNLGVYSEGKPVPAAPEVTPTGTTAVVRTSIWSSYGDQKVHVEVSPNADHGDATSTEPVTHDSGTWDFTLTGLTPGASYWARVVSESVDPVADGYTSSTDWVAFTADALTPALGAASATAVTQDGATVTVPVDAGRFDRSVVVETTPDADGAPVVRTEPQPVAAGTAAGDRVFDLAGLDSSTTYRWRVVSTSAGDPETTAWQGFTTAKVAAAVGTPTVSGLGTQRATVDVPVTTGDQDQQLRVEYSTRADHGGAIVTAPVDVAAADGPATVSVVLDGLAPGRTFHYRVLVRAEDGDELTSAWSTFATAVPEAPSVGLAPDPAGGTPAGWQVGDRVSLTWTAQDATGLVATGDWSGAKDVAGGTETVALTEPRTYVFGLEARGEGGRTTVSTTVVVVRADATFTVTSTTAPTFVGSTVPVRVTGLDAAEPFTVTAAGVRVASGVADAAGRGSALARLPRSIAAGTRTLAVVGSTPGRAGTTSVRLVGATRFATDVRWSQRRRGQVQKVTVTGLEAGEAVAVRAGGRLVSPTAAVARRDGSYVLRYRVRGPVGRQVVAVTGLAPARKGTVAYRVVRR